MKQLLILLIVGGALYAYWQKSEPQTADSGTTVEAAAQETDSLSFKSRMEHRIGAFAASIAGGQIRASVGKTERELAILTPAVKRTGGRSGANAKSVSRKIFVLDSLSLASLDSAHPIMAFRHAMDARGYIDIIRQEVSDETAAR